ncbi:Uncharacterised protein [Serratia proteamaculans]|nr:Uncharacterised protein [Serratia proteamaculans]CAI0834638.1 Uncharacterised protein [Serratia proteamaculans]CAI0840238.1 Uncharacterised protein [Serratia proteamaculans]CAI0840861.1 Uncharacterised protein [Serratia proteamaculans]CAI1748171.1 Uncharacterised protein [Serratia proteamaculans]
MLPVCIFYVAFFAHLTMLMMTASTGHTSYQQIKQEFQWAKPW